MLMWDYSAVLAPPIFILIGCPWQAEDLNERWVGLESLIPWIDRFLYNTFLLSFALNTLQNTFTPQWFLSNIQTPIKV